MATATNTDTIEYSCKFGTDAIFIGKCARKDGKDIDHTSDLSDLVPAGKGYVDCQTARPKSETDGSGHILFARIEGTFAGAIGTDCTVEFTRLGEKYTFNGSLDGSTLVEGVLVNVTRNVTIKGKFSGVYFKSGRITFDDGTTISGSGVEIPYYDVKNLDIVYALPCKNAGITYKDGKVEFTFIVKDGVYEKIHWKGGNEIYEGDFVSRSNKFMREGSGKLTLLDKNMTFVGEFSGGHFVNGKLYTKGPIDVEGVDNVVTVKIL